MSNWAEINPLSAGNHSVIGDDAHIDETMSNWAAINPLSAGNPSVIGDDARIDVDISPTAAIFASDSENSQDDTLGINRAGIIFDMQLDMLDISV